MGRAERLQEMRDSDPDWEVALPGSERARKLDAFIAEGKLPSWVNCRTCHRYIMASQVETAHQGHEIE